MRLLSNYTKFALTVFAFLSINFANAITYTTMNNGDWNDVINVWSTDGGFTPCGCTPGISSSGNDIIVNHNLTLSSNVNINGGSIFLLNVTGSLNGNFDFSSWNATLDIFGTATVKKFMQGVNASMTMHPGSIVIASGAFVVKDLSFTLDAAVINCAGLDVWAGATLNLTNASRVLVTSGNLTNDGIIDVGPASCMASNGNMKNNGTGSFLGSGSVNSGGNLNNSGIWDINLKWCAQGTGLGLPTPEDCVNADAICNAITLPVELLRFEAEAIAKEKIELIWETASEQNSSHFVIMKSVDGQNWKEIGSVDASGNSTESIVYGYLDYEISYGYIYYQLIMVDVDDRSEMSDVVTVFVEGEEIELSVFPNPSRNGDVINITNIEPTAGVSQIISMSGQVIQSEEFSGHSTSHQMSIDDLIPGIYFISIEQLGTRKTKRLVVTE